MHRADEIDSLDIVELDDGIELRMWLRPASAALVNAAAAAYRRPDRLRPLRHRVIAEAVRPAAIVAERHARFSPREIMAALAALAPLQRINIETRAVHAAAFWTRARGIVGAARGCRPPQCARQARRRAGAARHVRDATGMVLLTSRVSVEMVQKTAAIGAPLIVAVSAPTALAVRTAEAAGITLAAIARGDGFEVFTHPERIASASKHTTDVKEAVHVA